MIAALIRECKLSHYISRMQKYRTIQDFTVYLIICVVKVFAEIHLFCHKMSSVAILWGHIYNKSFVHNKHHSC